VIVALVTDLSSQYLSLPGPEHTAERLDIATELIRRAEAACDNEAALTARLWRITELLELGEIAEAEAEIELHAPLAERSGHGEALWRATVLRAMRALLNGRFDEAESLATRALEAGRRIQAPTAVDVFGAQMVALRREQGRLAETEALQKSFLTLCRRHDGWRSAFALLLIETGREDEARGELERVWAEHGGNPEPNLLWLTTVTTLAETCAFAGDTGRAAVLYERLRPYSDRCTVIGYGAVCLGSVSYQLALLARTMGRWQAAADHFEDALRVNAKIGATSVLARARHAFADFLLARIEAQPWGDVDAARARALELLQAALATYQQLGMHSCRERAAAAELRAVDAGTGNIRGVAPTSHDAPATGGAWAADLETGSDLAEEATADAAADPVQQPGTYRKLIGIRIGVCLTLCVVVPAGFLAAQGWPLSNWSPRTLPLLGIIGLATLVGFANRAAATSATSVKLPPRGVVYLVHWIDVLLATAAVSLLGGADVFIGVPIYALIVVHTAIEVPAGRVVALGVGAAGAYAITVLLLDAGWEAIFVRVALTHEELFRLRVTLAVVNAIFLTVLAFLTSTLAAVTRRQTARALRAEARLRVLNTKLESRVRERTAALHAANAALISVNVAVEDLGREIELYANAVSHDLRSHITAAAESLRLIGVQARDGAASLCDLGMQSLRSAERMLVGLRDLMRSRAKEPVKSVAVRALLEEIAGDIRRVRAAEHLPIEIAGTPFDVEAQPTKLRHLLWNLIDNAVVQTRALEGGRVEVGQKAEGGTAVFWVRDNGPGIPYAYQATVFEPFRRGPGQQGDGIGIGLALVRQIAQQHGGRVWVDSVPGQGATFRVTMPVRQLDRLEGTCTP
jgi:signal transduction histidine kinase/tetratricopeptide (TPR) repeat protein